MDHEQNVVSEESPANEQMNDGKVYFFNVVLLIYGVFTILFLYSFKFKISGAPIVNSSISAAWICGLLILVYTALSFKTVGPTEIAAKTFFGKPIQNVNSGWTLVPFLVCSLVLLTKNVIKLNIGSPQEIPIRDSNNQIVGTKIVDKSSLDNPFRVTFASRKSAIWQKRWWDPQSGTEIDEDKFPVDDHLAHRLTSDPQLLVRLEIYNPVLFIQTVGTVQAMTDLVAEVVKVTLQGYCSKRVASFVLYNLDDAADCLREQVERLIGDPDALKRARSRGDSEASIRKWAAEKPWGLNVRGVEIQNLGLPLHVNMKLSAARAAGYEKDEVALKSEAEKIRLTRIGEGEAAAITVKGRAAAAAEKDRLVAVGEGLNAIAAKTRRKGGPEALAAGTAIRIAEGVGNLVVTGGGSSPLSEVLGGLVAGKRVLQEDNKKTPPPTATPDSDSK